MDRNSTRAELFDQDNLVADWIIGQHRDRMTAFKDFPLKDRTLAAVKQPMPKFIDIKFEMSVPTAFAADDFVIHVIHKFYPAKLLELQFC